MLLRRFCESERNKNQKILSVDTLVHSGKNVCEMIMLFRLLKWMNLIIKNLFSKMLSVKPNSLLNDTAISLTMLDRGVFRQFPLSALVYFATTRNPYSRGYFLACFQGRPKTLGTRLECHFPNSRLVASSCSSVIN